MKLLNYIFILLLLLSCSNDNNVNNDMKAWKTTYWRMNKNSLLKETKKIFNNSPNTDRCVPSTIPKSVEECLIIIFEDYKMGSFFYKVYFTLHDNQLIRLSFSPIIERDQQRIDYAHRYSNGDILHEEELKVIELGNIAGKELYELVEKIHGVHTDKKVEMIGFAEYRREVPTYYWTSDFSDIELVPLSTYTTLTYEYNLLNKKI